MFTFFTLLHVTACIMLILIVLLQTGKGADMGAAFGGSTQTVFGSSGPAGFLNKMTTGVAILFMVTSLSLCYLSGRLPVPTIMDEGVEQTEKAAQPAEGQLPLPIEEKGEPIPGNLPE
jgi:preprotein translocase subunit SecG